MSEIDVLSLVVDGVDLTNYIAYKGLKYKISDIDAPNSGRTLDAVMHRGRVASKVRLDVICRPLTTREVTIVLKAIMPEWVTVSYYDPTYGQRVTKKMYSNNRPANHLIRKRDGTSYWDGIEFPLIEE